MIRIDKETSNKCSRYLEESGIPHHNWSVESLTCLALYSDVNGETVWSVGTIGKHRIYAIDPRFFESFLFLGRSV